MLGSLVKLVVLLMWLMGMENFVGSLGLVFLGRGLVLVVLLLLGLFYWVMKLFCMCRMVILF